MTHDLVVYNADLSSDNTLECTHFLHNLSFLEDKMRYLITYTFGEEWGTKLVLGGFLSILNTNIWHFKHFWKKL